MKTSIRLIVLLLIGLVAFSGCSAVRAILSGGSSSSEALGDASAGEAVAEEPVVAASFKLYDSWASW